MPLPQFSKTSLQRSRPRWRRPPPTRKHAAPPLWSERDWPVSRPEWARALQRSRPTHRLRDTASSAGKSGRVPRRGGSWKRIAANCPRASCASWSGAQRGYKRRLQHRLRAQLQCPRRGVALPRTGKGTSYLAPPCLSHSWPSPGRGRQTRAHRASVPRAAGSAHVRSSGSTECPAKRYQLLMGQSRIGPRVR